MNIPRVVLGGNALLVETVRGDKADDKACREQPGRESMLYSCGWLLQMVDLTLPPMPKEIISIIALFGKVIIPIMCPPAHLTSCAISLHRQTQPATRRGW